MAVLRSWSHLSGYSRFCVHFEKEERRRKRKRFFFKKQERESKKRKKEKEKKRNEKKRKRNIFHKKNHKTQKNHWTNCHIMIRKKKNSAGRNYSACFSSKVQNLTLLSINSMIRIRFSGSQELMWKAFSGAR